MNLRKARIDKTGKLEELLGSHLAVCLSGMPGIGRKTAVSMLLEKHPEVTPVFCAVEEIEDGSALARKKDGSPHWFLVRRPAGDRYPEPNDGFWRFIRKMSGKDRILLAVDGIMPESFLEFIWNGIMAVLLPEVFWLTEEETRQFLKRCKSDLKYQEVYYLTGGWAGCIAVLARLREQLAGTWTARELCFRYEVRQYIEKEILSSLPAEELRLLRERMAFPFLNEELVSVLWENPERETEGRLLARGAMVYLPEKEAWHVQPALRLAAQNYVSAETGRKAVAWYERNGHIQEALAACWHLNDRKMYRECLIRNYDKIPFLYYENTDRTGETRLPELFYLRWMESFLRQDTGRMREMRSTAAALWPQAEGKGKDERKLTEILLNIAYTDPLLTAREWMRLLAEKSDPEHPVRIYFMLGESVSYLSGLRDLSELFACGKKEREEYRRLWEERLAEENQIPYRLAEMEYDFYTDAAAGRKEQGAGALPRDEGNAPWQIRLGRMYLSYLSVNDAEQKEAARKHILKTAPVLEKEESGVCRWNARALSYLAKARWGEREELLRWIRENGGDIENETGKTKFYAAAEVKINFYLGNYSRAGELLRGLIPYFEQNRSWRWLAESLFQRALIEYENGDNAAALKTLAESLSVANPYRYVRIYTGYGHKGVKLLEEYRAWMQRNASEIQKKKKYKYGNVLRMPAADWIDYIIRRAARQKKYYLDLAEEQQNIYRVEKLTVTEQMVLKYLEKGYSNAEISESMNIKIATVKTHVYNIYKKLGVATRIQAVQRAREYGMI